ncbi:MAG: nitroreductase family protein [Desulfovibrionaceae bacterium]|nr:nitroreductase family protein [Desulfovibrionaceae bacterium]MBF0513597.1 nitroreductase family protein [Desulfovibrionaceae bacterium]
MDAIEAIMTRRSIRSFTPEAVTPGELETLLRAAMAAPSAGNQQPWHFVVIRDPAILAKIPAINPHAAMAAGAAAAVLICADESLEKFKGYWMQDCSAAMENLLLAAHALGLGAVWTGVYPVLERVEGFRALCGLPESVTPLGLAPIGHPAEIKPAVDRFAPARIHADTW